MSVGPYNLEGSPRKWFINHVAYRAPKEGEYYLSGAVVGVYKAYADLVTCYNVVELDCAAKQVTRWERDPDYPKS